MQQQQQQEPKIELIDNCPIPGATRIVDECYNYTDADQIGEGTYGKVYKGTDHRGHKVALKMIRMENEKEGFPITAIREIKLLSTLKHENIVNLREIVRSRVTRESNYKCDIYMVFDYAEHDLTGLMDATRQTGMRQDQIKCIMDQLLRGLAYCHRNGILHRDLKASNLLINRAGELKIADFGLARNWHDENSGKLTNRVITLWYRPPELLLGADTYGPAVDMWSVGCIFAELLTTKALFPGNSEADQLKKIFTVLGRPSEETWPEVTKLDYYGNMKLNMYKPEAGVKGLEAELKARGCQVPRDALNLLAKMLELNPAKRITAWDALFDDYFVKSDVQACAKRELPQLPDCHEWTTKKRKERERGGHHHHHQQQQQQPQHGHHHGPQHGGMGYAHQGGPMPYGPGSMPMRPHMQGPPAAAAAAGGYGQQPPRGPQGQDRSVRPRHSGGGGMGAAGPAAGQAGFKPGARPAGGYQYGYAPGQHRPPGANRPPNPPYGGGAYQQQQRWG